MRLLLLILFFPGIAQAHGLQYTVSSAQAVVVRLAQEDDRALAHARYEILPAGGTQPVQAGHTDALGRIVFLPDRPGRWRIKAVSEDGHGLDITLETDAAARLTVVDKPVHERHERILIGVAVILGLFGFVMLYMRGKKTPATR